MKKLNHWLVALSVVVFNLSYAQQFNVPVVQDFENTPSGSTTFSNNGMTYTISSSNSNFTVKNVTNGGFNGTSNDNRFIANTGNVVSGARLKISLEDGGIFNFHSAQIKFNNATEPFTLKLHAQHYGGTIGTVNVNLPQGTNGGNNGYFNLAFQNDATIPNITSLEFELPPGINLMYLDALKTSRDTPKIKSFLQLGDSECYQSYAVYAITTYGLIPPLTYNWSSDPGVNTSSIMTNVYGNHTVTVTDSTGANLSYGYSRIYNSQINYNLNINNSCNGANNGSASVTNITGGVPGNYEVYWIEENTNYTIGSGSTITDLPPGNYKVEVWDNINCFESKNFTIGENSPLTSTISKTDIKCYGSSTGTATVTPSGGQAPYTYVWTGSTSTSNTASGLSAGTYTVTVKDAANCTTTQTFVISQPTTPLAATTTQNNVSCNSGNTGSATVIPSGGTAPYTYVWTGSSSTSNTASGLSAGSYSVTVKDANNCSITKNFTITQPSPIIATTTQTNVSCNGGNNGTATVTASGGTGALSYSWNTTPVQTTATATGLTSGTYTVTIKDANNCSTTKTVNISQPTPLTATTTQTNASCGINNGTATVTASGGTGVLTYTWNTTPVQTTATASGLAAGTYNVTVKDANNCSIVKTVTISQPTAITATTTQTNATCNGTANGSATVTASGGSGNYTYSWNTVPVQNTATATGLSAGTYTVTVSDGINCPTTKSVTITEPTTIAATVSKVDVSCYGGTTGSATVTASGGTGSYTYSWNTTPVQTSATANSLSAGTYTVTIKDANNCSITKTVTIAQPTAITATTTQINPSCNGSATGSATVTASGGAGTLTYSWNTTPVQTTSTATGLTAGTYTVTIKDANNCGITKSVTIIDPTPITATLSQTDTTCGANNGTATVVATGGTGALTYTWNTTPVQTTATATGLAGGTYTVTIKDASNCTITKTVTINNSSSTAAPTGASTQNYTAGATLANLTVTGQNITWYATAVDAANHVNPLPTNTPLVHNTTYYATQTVGGCQSTASLPVTVMDNALTTSEIEIKSEKTTIYPNPTSSILNVKTKLNIEKVVIFDTAGRKVFERKLENNQVNVSSLSSGNYLIQIISKEKIENLKFIKH